MQWPMGFSMLSKSVGNISGADTVPSRYCRTCLMLGRALGSGCEQRSPSFSTKFTSSAAYSPLSLGSTTSRICPLLLFSSTQSSSTTWLSWRSCSRGLRPLTTSKRNTP
uniref:Uncharacterized protein n=1 Tax=Leersia perrieri TaxID=77586 RepID=A0A0D9VS40_9ORYZ